MGWELCTPSYFILLQLMVSSSWKKEDIVIHNGWTPEDNSSSCDTSGGGHSGSRCNHCVGSSNCHGSSNSGRRGGSGGCRGSSSSVLNKVLSQNLMCHYLPHPLSHCSYR